MRNLLKETLELLEINNKKETDVKWLITHINTKKISKKTNQNVKLNYYIYS